MTRTAFIQLSSGQVVEAVIDESTTPEMLALWAPPPPLPLAYDISRWRALDWRRALSTSTRAEIVNSIEQFADAHARRHVVPAFDGDADAALSLLTGLSNNKRGHMAIAMWHLKVKNPGFTTFLTGVWMQDHHHLVHAARSLKRLVEMFAASDAPRPRDDGKITVWRGTQKVDAETAVKGYSWTTDRDAACWFAMRPPGVDPLVLRATVASSAVAYFTDERNESETLILGKVKGAVIDGDVADWTVAAERSTSAVRQRREAWLTEIEESRARGK